MRAKQVKGADFAIPPMRMTHTMNCLIDHYFKSVIKCGPVTLPVLIDDSDPEDTDDEFFEHVALSHPI